MATAAIILILCSHSISALAAANEVTSTDLIDNARTYDGSLVVYTGEIVGDIMIRGDHAWINVSDGDNAIGIWMSTADLKGIDTAGRYNMHGDEVKITGMFNRACAEHGGDFDIHGASIELIKEGYPIYHPVSIKEIIAALFLFMGAVMCMILIQRKNMKISAG